VAIKIVFCNFMSRGVGVSYSRITIIDRIDYLRYIAIVRSVYYNLFVDGTFLLS